MGEKRFFSMCLTIFFSLILTISLFAETYDLTSPDSWYFLGTVYKYEKGFLLGDSDGYTQGDSCYYLWIGENYDYDDAISKIAFKPPFEFEFKTAVDSTSYGYNLIEISCLSDKLTDETPFIQCTDIMPITTSSVGSVYYGKKWEEGNKLCAGVGIPSREKSACIEDKDRFYKVKITMDENHNTKIYINNEEIYSGNFGTCKAHNGYMVIHMKTFDSQIDFLEGKLEAENIKPIKEIISGSEISNSNNENSEYDKGYNDGYQAGVEFCKNNPEKCGIVCKKEEQQNINSCEATYNLFENKLHIPCLKLDKSYWLDLKLINSNPVQLELTGFGEN